MNEIAQAAGCSRATLYRYFESRRRCAPPTCTVRLTGCSSEIKELIDDISDPRERLLAGLTATMRLVRDSPALSSWFTTCRLAHGGGDG